LFQVPHFYFWRRVKLCLQFKIFLIWIQSFDSNSNLQPKISKHIFYFPGQHKMFSAHLAYRPNPFPPSLFIFLLLLAQFTLPTQQPRPAFRPTSPFCPPLAKQRRRPRLAASSPSAHLLHHPLDKRYPTGTQSLSSPGPEAGGLRRE
jgi:hypothetical protein